MQPQVRQITKGPKFHWFGYYDKLEFDATGRCVLGMEVDFENRPPTNDDVVKVGMVDLEDGDRWIELGETRAWCWQQGCMLQWRPGHEDEVIWNDIDIAGGRFISHVLNVKTGDKRMLPMPMYSLSPDGKTAVMPDLRRVQDMRSGYGYPGLPDPNSEVLAPDDAGIWRMDVDTGDTELIVTHADMLKFPCDRCEGVDLLPQFKQWFNHLLFSPDGTRLIFLNRYMWEFHTRLVTVGVDGSDICVVEDYGGASHFIWRDPRHILCWSYRHPSDKPGFYLYEDKTSKDELIGEGKMVENGHCTYLKNLDWILNDTYGSAEKGQDLFLYHVPTDRKIMLGTFASPAEYTGDWRCDLHPRSSRDGKLVVFDSPHTGEGRQLHLVDISSIVDE